MSEENSICVMTTQSIDAFIQHAQDQGLSKKSVGNLKRVTSFLYEWLPEDKVLSKERLLAWRKSLNDHGYSQQTELNFVKGINRYLDYMGWSSIRFNRGRGRDIAGKQFGYLTAIELTGEKKDRGLVWRCRCSCGQEVELVASRLLTGNNLSCGCLRGEHFKELNKYIGGTSLRQSIEEQVRSTRAMSGYTGVTVKRGKWLAHIAYKGKHITLGCYDKLEDAVKARARGKELVQLDAMGLLDIYEELHKDDPLLPQREEIRNQHKQPKQEQPPSSMLPARRSSNTSGYPGVHKKRDKWAAKITWEKVTYHLGCYKTIDEAIAVRKEAEQALQQDPAGFPEWVLNRGSRRR